jgi:hypothetical protein
MEDTIKIKQGTNKNRGEKGAEGDARAGHRDARPCVGGRGPTCGRKKMGKKGRERESVWIF